MREHHKELHDAGVTLAVNFAKAGENSEGAKPALRREGHPIVATINKASEKETAQKRDDLLITIDGHKWKDITDEDAMKAEIDAVLCRVKIHREGNTEDGKVLEDANGRPKMRYVDPDFRIVGYKENVERYHRKAPPSKALLEFKEQNSQLFLFMDGNGHG